MPRLRGHLTLLLPEMHAPAKGHPDFLSPKGHLPISSPRTRSSDPDPIPCTACRACAGPGSGALHLAHLQRHQHLKHLLWRAPETDALSPTQPPSGDFSQGPSSHPGLSLRLPPSLGPAHSGLPHSPDRPNHAPHSISVSTV